MTQKYPRPPSQPLIKLTTKNKFVCNMFLKLRHESQPYYYYLPIYIFVRRFSYYKGGIRWHMLGGTLAEVLPPQKLLWHFTSDNNVVSTYILQRSKTKFVRHFTTFGPGKNARRMCGPQTGKINVPKLHHRKNVYCIFYANFIRFSEFFFIFGLNILEGGLRIRWGTSQFSGSRSPHHFG